MVRILICRRWAWSFLSSFVLYVYDLLLQNSTPVSSLTNNISSPTNDMCPPTVPASPISLHTRPCIFLRNQNHATYYQPPSPPKLRLLAISFPAPIIAPPSFDLIPKAPLSAEDAAEGRLRRLLKRERKMRVGMGLGMVWVLMLNGLAMGGRKRWKGEIGGKMRWMTDLRRTVTIQKSTPSRKLTP